MRAMAIPEHILAAAPESPWGFPVGAFAHAAEHAAVTESPSRTRASEALGSSVLDVGCGAGAAAVGLVPPAIEVTGVDELQPMLDEFERRVAERGATCRTIRGRWPDVAGEVEPVDVVVCHNVAYNVSDLAPFVAALDAAATRRVVVELTAVHPLGWLDPLWPALHGIEIGPSPDATDAEQVIADAGFDVRVQRWTVERPYLHGDDELVAFARKRLCVGPERDDEVAAVLAGNRPPVHRDIVAMWWDVRSG